MTHYICKYADTYTHNFLNKAKYKYKKTCDDIMYEQMVLHMKNKIDRIVRLIE